MDAILAQTPWPYALLALAVSALFWALQKANDKTIEILNATIADLRTRLDGQAAAQTVATQELAAGFGEMVAVSKVRRESMDRNVGEVMELLREMRAESRARRGGD